MTVTEPTEPTEPEDTPPDPPEPTGDEDTDAAGDPLAAEDSSETPPGEL